MGSRFLTGLTLADLVTLGNAVIGLLATLLAPSDPQLAARLILLAAVLDGLDGVLARQLGGSAMGPYLDSLADVSSFGVAPAVTVYVVVSQLGIPGVAGSLEVILLLGVVSVYFALALLRLGAYSAYDIADTSTVGAPSTLAATIIGTAILTTPWNGMLVIGATAVLAIAMIGPISYPDLLARDAVIMGVVHMLAVLLPQFYGRVFPYALLTLATAYLVLGPCCYWGESERRLRDVTPEKG